MPQPTGSESMIVWPEEFRDGFRGAGDDVIALARDALDHGARAWMRALEAISPTGETGALKRGTRITRSVGRRGGRFASYRLRFTVDYVGFVIRGTQPHTITARPGHVLRFAAGGRTLFRRGVRHPGTRPNPFPTRAYEMADVPRIMADARRQISQRLHGRR